MELDRNPINVNDYQSTINITSREYNNLCQVGSDTVVSVMRLNITLAIAVRIGSQPEQRTALVTERLAAITIEIGVEPRKRYQLTCSNRF